MKLDPTESQRRVGRREDQIIRLMDVFLASMGLLLVLPILLPIAVILKLTGEHDIFYRQIRIGKGGNSFRILKFATMLRDSPNMAGGLITLPNDPRLLPMGNFLRKTKINELPQLINVLIGDMSMVGYRPFAKAHFDVYSDNVKQLIGQISPGLTGIGSIVFRNEEEILHRVENREEFHDRLITPYKGLLESWYVRNRSGWTYLKIIFCTFLVLLDCRTSMWKTLFTGIPETPKELEPYID